MAAVSDRHTMVSLLMDAGLGRVQATMLVPYMFFRPATTDPYSPVITTLVKALQHRLGQMGVKTRGDGYVDLPTHKALSRIVGKNWRNITWGAVVKKLNFSTGVVNRPEVQMSYVQAMGSIERGAWCSDLNPQGDCRPLINICKPMDKPTAVLFKTLQSELNRAALATKNSPVPVDARPGKDTIVLANKILGTKFTHCDQLCARADELIKQVASFNKSVGAPLKAPAKPAKPNIGSGVDMGPLDVSIHAQQGGIGSVLFSLPGMVAAGVGLAIYLGTRPDKKKGKK